MKKLLILGSIVAFGWVSACALLDQFEITYGSGKHKLHPVKLEVLLPELDSLGVLDTLPGEVPGPSDYGTKPEVTMAHLLGAMRLLGGCCHGAPARQENVEGAIDADATTLTLCDCATERCDWLCPEEVDHGLMLDLSIRAQILSEERAASIRKTLVSISPEAVRQFRLRVLLIEPYETLSDTTGDPLERSVADRITGFSMAVATLAGDREPLLGWEDLQLLASADPQRYDLPRDSPVMESIIGNLLAGEAVWIDLEVALWFPEDVLYDILVAGSGIRVDLQPELVLSVRDIAKTRL